jgi:fluoroacetyl-CoA thioesterase
MSGADSGFRVGAAGEITLQVTPEMTAAHYGNPGVEVLATPYLIGLLEDAAVEAIQAALPPGLATVGTHVAIQHEAATPVGMRVTAQARLTEVDGRRLAFEVEAHDETERVASGTHERYIVDLGRFLQRVGAKKPAHPG